MHRCVDELERSGGVVRPGTGQARLAYWQLCVGPTGTKLMGGLLVAAQGLDLTKISVDHLGRPINV